MNLGFNVIFVSKGISGGSPQCFSGVGPPRVRIWSCHRRRAEPQVPGSAFCQLRGTAPPGARDQSRKLGLSAERRPLVCPWTFSLICDLEYRITSAPAPSPRLENKNKQTNKKSLILTSQAWASSSPGRPEGAEDSCVGGGEHFGPTSPPGQESHLATRDPSRRPQGVSPPSHRPVPGPGPARFPGRQPRRQSRFPLSARPLSLFGHLSLDLLSAESQNLAHVSERSKDRAPRGCPSAPGPAAQRPPDFCPGSWTSGAHRGHFPPMRMPPWRVRKEKKKEEKRRDAKPLQPGPFPLLCVTPPPRLKPPPAGFPPGGEGPERREAGRAPGSHRPTSPPQRGVCQRFPALEAPKKVAGSQRTLSARNLLPPFLVLIPLDTRTQKSPELLSSSRGPNPPNSSTLGIDPSYPALETAWTTHLQDSSLTSTPGAASRT